MNRIKHFRKRAGMTQEQLGQACGIDRVPQIRISKYEKGSRRPDLELCRRIVHELNTAGVACDLDDVFPFEPVDSSEVA